MNDTIAAISSSGGPIGLIRVSGERAIEAINAVFQAKNGKPLTEAPSQKLKTGDLTYTTLGTLEPMNPYERRIIHAALQDFNGVTTYSTGTEPSRRVVIAPDSGRQRH